MSGVSCASGAVSRVSALCVSQEFLIAVGVRGATLQHRMVHPSLGWYDQVTYTWPAPPGPHTHTQALHLHSATNPLWSDFLLVFPGVWNR